MKNDKKKYYIPMEVTDETIKDFDIDPKDVRIHRIGNRTVRVIYVPATKEQYLEYMRPIWREQKRLKRHSDTVLLDNMNYGEETNTAFSDCIQSTETDEIIQALYKLLDELCEIDREIISLYFFENETETQIAEKIGIGQRCVNKRKNRILRNLKDKLSEYI